jgi:hypothetical protein
VRLAAAFVSLLLVGPFDVAIGARAPLDAAAVALRSHLALQALDRYLETWNSRNPRLWASSLHYPHIRPGPGAFELSRTPEEYAAGVNFAQTLATGWHHSEWTSRRVLQVGVDKVHVAGQWTRYAEDGRELTGSAITYILTNQNGRWGVLSRFAAGGSRIDAAVAAKNAAAARNAVEVYMRAWNSHDPDAVAAALHYPHVRIADDAVEVWPSAKEFLAGPEPGRQRTWYETRLDGVEVAQASTGGVNVTVTYSLRDRSGHALSQYEGLFLATERDGAWKVQAFSGMGT